MFADHLLNNRPHAKHYFEFGTLDNILGESIKGRISFIKLSTALYFITTILMSMIIDLLSE